MFLGGSGFPSKVAKPKKGALILIWLLGYQGDNGHVEIVRLLLEAGVDKDLQDWYGDTALHRASLSGQVDIARLLLEARADKDVLSRSGNTALSFWVARWYPFPSFGFKAPLQSNPKP